MKVYSLTPRGQALSRTTNNPDVPAWRVVYCLRNLGNATPEQVSNFTGLSQGEVGSVLNRLVRKGIVVGG